jgi:hypothetical protein
MVEQHSVKSLHFPDFAVLIRSPAWRQQALALEAHVGLWKPWDWKEEKSMVVVF